MPLYGIAIGEVLAIADSPLRKVSVEEVTAARDEGLPIAHVCPICHKEGQVALAAESDGKIILFDTLEHQAEYTNALIAQEMLTLPPTDWTISPKDVLYIRVGFADTGNEPISIADADAQVNAVSKFLFTNSCAKTWLTGFITDTFYLSGTKEYYRTHDNGEFFLHSNAVQAAINDGWDTNDFHILVVAWEGFEDYITPSGRTNWHFSGMADVEGSRIWLNMLGEPSYYTHVLAHELGHSYGLWHANWWETIDGTPTGPGESQEYGDPYDVMGNSSSFPSGHFGMSFKAQLRWLEQGSGGYAAVISNGVYRIYAHDIPESDGHLRALKIPYRNGTNYWVEFRQQFSEFPAIMNGALIRWDSGSVNYHHNLLDMTPGSHPATENDKQDCSLQVGQTFVDTQAGIVISVLGSGGTWPTSLDVQVVLMPQADQYLEFRDPYGSDLLFVHQYGMATQLPVGTQAKGIPKVSPDGTKLCYPTYHYSDRHIYAINTDGQSPPLKVSPDVNFDDTPWWTSDGECIIYHRLPSGFEKTNQIRVVRYDSTNSTSIYTTTNGFTGMSFCAVNNRIAFIRGDYGSFPVPYNIWVMDMGDSDPIQVASFTDATSPARLSLSGPVWSPDGRYIAFLSYESSYKNYKLWLCDVESSSTRMVCSGVSSAGWSPDGTRIGCTTTNNRVAIVYPFDIENPIDIYSSVTNWFGCWSPDGQYFTALTATSGYLCRILPGDRSIEINPPHPSFPFGYRICAWWKSNQRGCTYNLSSSSASFAPTGGSGSFAVTTGSSCRWVAIASADWIHTSSAGTGNGFVSYTVEPNSGPARSAVIAVGNQVHWVWQITPHDAWLADYFTPDERTNPTVSGVMADPDGDGIFNLMEYALDLNPKLANVTGLPTTVLTNDYLTLTYRKSKQATDISYLVEACAVLNTNSWSTNGLAILSTVDSNTYWLVIVRDAVPMSSATNRFMRLKVTKP